MVFTASALARNAALMRSPNVVGNPNGPISGLRGPKSAYMSIPHGGEVGW